MEHTSDPGSSGHEIVVESSMSMQSQATYMSVYMRAKDCIRTAVLEV